MKLRIVRHREAMRDAVRIFSYVGENNLDAAERFLHAIDADFHKLADMHGMGAKREFDHPKLKDLRSCPVTDFRNYLIFYRVVASDLQVLRILHGARDIEAVLLG